MIYKWNFQYHLLLNEFLWSKFFRSFYFYFLILREEFGVDPHNLITQMRYENTTTWASSTRRLDYMSKRFYLILLYIGNKLMHLNGIQQIAHTWIWEPMPKSNQCKYLARMFKNCNFGRRHIRRIYRVWNSR